MLASDMHVDSTLYGAAWFYLHPSIVQVSKLIFSHITMFPVKEDDLNNHSITAPGAVRVVGAYSVPQEFADDLLCKYFLICPGGARTQNGVNCESTLNTVLGSPSRIGVDDCVRRLHAKLNFVAVELNAVPSPRVTHVDLQIKDSTSAFRCPKIDFKVFQRLHVRPSVTGCC